MSPIFSHSLPIITSSSQPLSRTLVASFYTPLNRQEMPPPPYLRPPCSALDTSKPLPPLPYQKFSPYYSKFLETLTTKISNFRPFIRFHDGESPRYRILLIKLAHIDRLNFIENQKLLGRYDNSRKELKDMLDELEVMETVVEGLVRDEMDAVNKPTKEVMMMRQEGTRVAEGVEEWEKEIRRKLEKWKETRRAELQDIYSKIRTLEKLNRGLRPLGNTRRRWQGGAGNANPQQASS